jgi:FkbH-like protein
VYQFDWANEELWASERTLEIAPPSRLPRDRVERTMLLHWQEHCIECAPPQCYSLCPLYVARADRKCARFVYGVFPNARFSGLFDHGADVRFRRWAKLEAELQGRAMSVDAHRRADRIDRAATRAVTTAAGALSLVNPRRRLNGVLTVARDAVFRRLAPGDRRAFDEFVLECYSPDEEPFRLVLEHVRGDAVDLRHSFEIEHGHNFHTLPADRFGHGGRVLVYPENDAERRLVFTWLDFVKYADGVRRDAAGPAAKVKVVAWDLDDTLWHGTLLEDGADALALREDVAALVRALDERGVLQTVVSKNDHDDAWPVVQRHGLDEYFLFPAINWGRKSQSLRQVAERLNLGLEAFAFVDDSPFERAEVEQALPGVRVYSADQVGELLGLPEFDVPITETSRSRRRLYQVEAERGRAQAAFGDDYEAFLRSCGMQMEVAPPSSEAEIARCLELVQRSNQLNLASRRYSAKEFRELLGTPGILSLRVRCSDRFGDYGIVGFCAVDERGEVPLVLDYVLSCRVAQKRVEQTFFEWLGVREAERGADRLHAGLVETSRNVALRRVFDELPFRVVSRDGPRVVLELPLDPPPPIGDVIRLEAQPVLAPE